MRARIRDVDCEAHILGWAKKWSSFPNPENQPNFPIDIPTLFSENGKKKWHKVHSNKHKRWNNMRVKNKPRKLVFHRNWYYLLINRPPRTSLKRLEISTATLIAKLHRQSNEVVYHGSNNLFQLNEISRLSAGYRFRRCTISRCYEWIFRTSAPSKVSYSNMDAAHPASPIRYWFDLRLRRAGSRHRICIRNYKGALCDGAATYITKPCLLFDCTEIASRATACAQLTCMISWMRDADSAIGLSIRDALDLFFRTDQVKRFWFCFSFGESLRRWAY